MVVTATHAQTGSQQAATAQIPITGTVKDQLNVAMSGVTIQNRNSGKTVTTNEKGAFAITAAKGDSLVATHVGYKDYPFSLNDRITFSIVMEASSGSLNDVVVVGFGQQKKISLVGAQSSVNVEDLKQPVANLSATLAGRIAGLVGVQRSGLPGQDGADLWIRGISTFSGNTQGPLIIIDGVQGRDINSLDPEDVASFTILKDASATAVYGVAGANGVILIKTKVGKPGKSALTFNYSEGINSFTKTPELIDGVNYMKLRNEAEVATGLSPEYSPAFIDSTISGKSPYVYPNVNWTKALFNKLSDSRKANFNARGGSEAATYYVALSYYDEASLLKTDGVQKYNADTRFRRYNFTSNLNMNWTKTTKFEMGIQGYITNTNYPGYSPGDAYGQLMLVNPVLYPVMYPGNIIPAVSDQGDQRNPYAMITQSGYQNYFSNQVYTNARLTQDLGSLVPGLSISGLYSFDIFHIDTTIRNRWPNTYLVDKNNPYQSDGSLNLVQIGQGNDALAYTRHNDGNRQFYLEASVNYDHNIDARNHVSGLLLYNQKDYTEAEAKATDLTSSIPYRNRGIAGRATYSWSDRYFGEFNFGYNGSENFAPANRYGFFPSVGLGWVLSNEPFYQPLKKAVQFLKVRYSDGLVGSSGGGRRFGYLDIVTSPDGNAGYTFGNGSNNINYQGISISDYASDVRWSKSHKQDLGVELKTLDSKLSLTIDFFKEHRSGVFLQRGGLADFAGLQNNPWGNLGIINNQGIDGTIESAPVRIGNTSWSFRGTFSYNRDKVIENDDPSQIYPYMEARGTNLLARFGYVAQGLFQSQKEIDNSPDQSSLGNVRVGDIRYKDLNGDGKIDAYDITRIGHGDVPSFIYGAGFNVNWKQFYFGLLFQGVSGADRQISGDGIIPFNNGGGADRSNLYAIAENRWTPENPDPHAFYPRLAYGQAANANNSVTSSWWIKDISFIRLKSVDLGYFLPKGTLHSIGLKSSQIYMQGVNLFYLSKFKLWDPELNTSNGAAYPNIRTVTLGIRANF